MDYQNDTSDTCMDMANVRAAVDTMAYKINGQTRSMDGHGRLIGFWFSAVTIIAVGLLPATTSRAGGQLSANGDDVQAASTDQDSESTTDESDASPAKEGKIATAATCGDRPAEGVQQRRLFDGTSLKGWSKTKFGGEGTVTAKDGVLRLGFGSFMTGVTYAGKTPLPTSNYEVVLEARRADGTDFFCGLTVPYRESHFSLIVGGWGGGVTGISSIDGLDASENDTTSYTPYKKGQWYCIRLKVSDDRIEAWIDKEQVVDFEVDEQNFSTRLEVDLSKPLGICSFDTHAELRNIRLRTWDATTVPDDRSKDDRSPENRSDGDASTDCK